MSTEWRFLANVIRFCFEITFAQGFCVFLWVVILASHFFKVTIKAYDSASLSIFLVLKFSYESSSDYFNFTVSQRTILFSISGIKEICDMKLGLNWGCNFVSQFPTVQEGKYSRSQNEDGGLSSSRSQPNVWYFNPSIRCSSEPDQPSQSFPELLYRSTDFEALKLPKSWSGWYWSLGAYYN